MNRFFLMFAWTLTTTLFSPALTARAADFVIYSIYQGVDLGDPQNAPKKDYFMNMGSTQGLRSGMLVEVSRRTPTYDSIAEKLYQEVTFPIARLKIIHVEPRAAIARLERILPADNTPAISPRAVMVGDLVRVVQ